MKIALLGLGKTGSKVLELAPQAECFNTKNIPTLEKLSQCDVIISFLPGDAFLEYIELLIESGKPVVTGSTGFDWPQDINEKLEDKKCAWVKSHNFSLGMNIVRMMIEKMSLLDKLFDDGKFSIHDIHHIHKKDAPSGTALSWKEWLGVECEITAERKGDIIGYHHMIFDSPSEKITLIHEANDRSIFAKGALFAANILSKRDTPSGLHDFNQLIKNYLNI